MEKVNEIYSWFKLKDQKVPVIRRHIKDGPITEYTDEIHHSRHLFLFNDIFILAVSKKPKEFTSTYICFSILNKLTQIYSSYSPGRFN